VEFTELCTNQQTTIHCCSNCLNQFQRLTKHVLQCTKNIYDNHLFNDQLLR